MTDLRKLVTPFSVGKRNCPGESVAQVVSFLMLMHAVRNLEISCVPGEAPPSQDFLVGITSHPKPFNILLTYRKSVKNNV